MAQIMKPRVMYIENKSTGLSGSARIGRVTFSKTGKSLYYQGRRFQTLSDMVSRLTTSTVSPGTSIGSRGARRTVRIGSILAESKSTQTFVTSTGRRSGSNPRSERKPSYAVSASMVRANNEQPQNKEMKLPGHCWYHEWSGSPRAGHLQSAS